MRYLYQITLKYACFGLEVENEIIIDAANIAKWTIGKNLKYVINYYKKKNTFLKIKKVDY